MPYDKLMLEDYQKIMEIAYLDPFAKNYHKQVLSLLKSLFMINLAAYTCWLPDNRLSVCLSLGFSEDFMNNIHDLYVHDRMRKLAIEKLASNTWNGIFYSQDTDTSAISGNKMMEYLHENNIHYFATMVLSSDPRENYILCKTEKEGPFSEREKAILQIIYNVAARNLSLRHTYQKNRHALAVINSHCDSLKTGLILTDAERNVLSFNDSAFSLVPRRLNLTRISEIVSFVFQLFDEASEQEQDPRVRTVSYSGRNFMLEEMSFMSEEGILSEFFLITITRNSQIVQKIGIDITARYGLTEREAQIAELLISGYSNQEIGDTLHISVSTVKIHISNLFRKLNVHTRMEATLKLSGTQQVHT